MPKRKFQLPEHVPLQRPMLAALAKEGAILDAKFVAGDYANGHGMVLFVDFVGSIAGEDPELGTTERVGILYKQDDLPRVFTTPESIMGNAFKLGIHSYRVEAEAWRANYYKLYEAQVKSRGGQVRQANA